MIDENKLSMGKAVLMRALQGLEEELQSLAESERIVIRNEFVLSADDVPAFRLLARLFNGRELTAASIKDAMHMLLLMQACGTLYQLGVDPVEFRTKADGELLMADTNYCMLALPDEAGENDDEVAIEAIKTAMWWLISLEAIPD